MPRMGIEAFCTLICAGKLTGGFPYDEGEHEDENADGEEAELLDARAAFRRRFLSWFGLAWVSFAAATGGALSILLRFLFPNVVFEPPTSFKAGFPGDYEIGKVDERWKEKFGVWMVRVAEGIYALSTICTHLGCTPNWLDTENKFRSEERRVG